jgi:NADH-quinone oxidoreductase subunit N
MTLHELVAIGPLIVVAATIAVLLIAIAVRRSHVVTAVLALAGIALALGALVRPPVSAAMPLLAFDEYARIYSGLILAAAAAVTLLSYGYLERLDEQREEFYVLLLLATLGSLILVCASHFASFFLGLEMLSVSLYALIAYPRTREQGIEAGLKYLVLAATSAAFLLFGMALVYAATGTLELARMAAAPANGASGGMTLVGVALIVVGVGFKLALVPFHLWTPDVYQGAPAPVTAFVSTVSKGAMFGLLLRYAAAVALPAHHALVVIFIVLAVASMVAGNLLALLQDNVKRLLAYSSIAHLGYLLVAFLAGGAAAAAAVTFYLVANFHATIGAFGVITVLSGAEVEAERLDDYRGLFVRRPWLSVVFAAMLLSLAGIPLTAGFVGKFYLTVVAGGAALWALLVVMMLTSGVGLFYYLRVIVAMFMQRRGTSMETDAATIPLVAELTLAAVAILLIWIGLYPAPILALARTAAI